MEVEDTAGFPRPIKIAPSRTTTRAAATKRSAPQEVATDVHGTRRTSSRPVKSARVYTPETIVPPPPRKQATVTAAPLAVKRSSRLQSRAEAAAIVVVVAKTTQGSKKATRGGRKNIVSTTTTTTSGRTKKKKTAKKEVASHAAAPDVAVVAEAAESMKTVAALEEEMEIEEKGEAADDPPASSSKQKKKPEDEEKKGEEGTKTVEEQPQPTHDSQEDKQKSSATTTTTPTIFEPPQPPTTTTNDDSSWWDPLDPGKVSEVQAALHVSAACVPGQLPLCRDSQVQSVDAWLAEKLQTGQGGSMYISGLPGTGKSLTALELVRRCGRHVKNNSVCPLPPALLAINCMRFSEPKQVVERILAGYRTSRAQQMDGGGGDVEEDPLVQVPCEEQTNLLRRMSSGGGGGGGPDCQELLRRVALQPLVNTTTTTAEEDEQQKKKGKGKGRRSSAGGRRSSLTLGGAANNDSNSSNSGGGNERGMIVAVLDELDGLLTGRNGDALVGELFSLAHAPRSRLILIGVANSIDLVQQLMRVGGTLHRHNLRPAHVIFPAYLSSQVVELITQRLCSLPGPVFDAKAVLFCARKIANGTGDMRLALEACSKAVAILAADEQERVLQKKESEGEVVRIEGGSSSSSGPSAVVVPEKEKEIENKMNARVGLRPMAAALSKITGGMGVTNAIVGVIKKLPVPQQLLMATVAKLLGEKMGGRGLAVKVPSARGPFSAASHFIGTGIVETPLLVDFDSIAFNNGSSSTKKGGKRASLGAGHKRRGSFTAAAPGPGELTVADLKAAHAGLCKRVGVGMYSGSEFATAMDMLSTMGLVEVKGGAGQGPRQRVTLQIAEDDVLMALADIPVLKDVVGA